MSLYQDSATLWRRSSGSFQRVILAGVKVEETESIATSGTVSPVSTSKIKVFIPYESAIKTGDFIAAGVQVEDEPTDVAHEVVAIQRESLFGNAHHLEVQG